MGGGCHVFYAKSCVWTGKTRGVYGSIERIEVKTGGIAKKMPSLENMGEKRWNSTSREFIEFMVESRVLKFGEFTLKSGRKSPFFMNAGAYVTGSQLKRLGEYYAKAIHDNYGLDFDVLFGPAYKGIPLSVVTAIAIHDLYGVEVRYCSTGKKQKTTAEMQDCCLEAKIKDGDRVVIIEDIYHLRKIHRGDVPDHPGTGQCGDQRSDGILKPYGARKRRQERT